MTSPPQPAKPSFRIFRPILAGASLKDRMIASLGAVVGITATALVCTLATLSLPLTAAAHDVRGSALYLDVGQRAIALELHLPYRQPQFFRRLPLLNQSLLRLLQRHQPVSLGLRHH